MFHYENGYHFQRLADGSVRIFRSWPEPGKVAPIESDIVTINAAGWASIVLSVSAFDERPGDWQAFMDHHMGRKDMLVGQRGGY